MSNFNKLFDKAIAATSRKKIVNSGTYGVSKASLPTIVHGIPANGRYVGICQAFHVRLKSTTTSAVDTAMAS